MRTVPKKRVVSVTWGSDLITGPANRVIATVQNGVEVLRFGGLQDRNSCVAVSDRGTVRHVPATTLLPRKTPTIHHGHR